jgi:hypothetical protein
MTLQRRAVSEKFRLSDETYSVEVLDTVDGMVDATVILDGFTAFINALRKNNAFTPHDRVMILINNVSDGHMFPLMDHVKPLSDVDAEQLLDYLSKQIQSGYILKPGDATIIVKRFAPPARAGGSESLRPDDLNLYSKRSILKVDGGAQSTCVMQSIGLLLAKRCAKACLRNIPIEIPKYGLLSTYKHKQSNREQFALQLHEVLDIPVGPISTEEFPALETRLKEKFHIELTLNVYDYRAHEFVYPSEGRAPSPINLYLCLDTAGDQPHMDAITNIKAFMGQRKFCQYCNHPFSKSHVCTFACNACGTFECSERLMKSPRTMTCNVCMFKFASQECFDNHRANHLCTKRKICTACDTCYTPTNERLKEKIEKLLGRAVDDHECGMAWCPTCQDYLKIDHPQCVILKGGHNRKCITKTEYISMSKADQKLHQPMDSIYAWDIESDVSGLTHTPMLVVIEDEEGVQREFAHTTDTTAIDSFCEYIFTKLQKGSILLSHNGGRYDTHFVYQYAVRKNLEITNEIISGSKITAVCINDLKFLDFHRFVSQPLAVLPKMFGLHSGGKGHFPYRFATLANLHTTYPQAPGIAWFDLDQICKSEDRKQEIITWHEGIKNTPYNVYDECLQYCKQDVNILMASAKAFRALGLELSQDVVDPFMVSTIAGYVNRVYYALHYDGSLMTDSNDRMVHHNKHESEWLTYMGVKSRRQQLGKYIVDGLKEQVVYSYHDCYINGCSRCYQPAMLNKPAHATMGQLYARTINKRKAIEALGYTVLEMWGCEWASHKCGNIAVKEFMLSYEPINSALTIRDALFGGRTEVFTLHHECKGNEEVRAADIISLYPSVNYGLVHGITDETYADIEELSYPVGASEYRNYTDSETLAEDITNEDLFGFVHCTLDSPRGVMFPSVPYRSARGKLTFTLCAKCANTNHQARCEHTPEERRLLGTWDTATIKQALEDGYSICRIGAVLHYPGRSSTLFRSYIEDFLKVKQEASGYPSDYDHNDHERAVYRADYESDMGIVLDPTQIVKNPGLRSFAKMCLNSLWGKFGQRSDIASTELVSSVQRYNDLMFSPRYAVTDVAIVDAKHCKVTYKTMVEYRRDSTKTNAPVACFTTAHARLRLLKGLRAIAKSGMQVLYSDTDSIYYVQDTEKPSPIRLGHNLGDFEDDISGTDEHGPVLEFVATAPKSYGYRYRDGKCNVKAKGFTLSIQNAQSVNFNGYKAMVNDHSKSLTIHETRFDIEKRHNEISSKSLTKTMGFTFDKRVILPNNQTLPFGF